MSEKKPIKIKVNSEEASDTPGTEEAATDDETATAPQQDGAESVEPETAADEPTPEE